MQVDIYNQRRNLVKEEMDRRMEMTRESRSNTMRELYDMARYGHDEKMMGPESIGSPIPTEIMFRILHEKMNELDGVKQMVLVVLDQSVRVSRVRGMLQKVTGLDIKELLL